MTGVRVVEASGPPQERGRAIGRALADLIGRSVEYYHKYFDRRGVASADLQDLLAPYLAAAERHLPAHMETIKGMSEGAMVPVWELFAINAFEELEPLLESPDGQPLFLWRKEGYSTAPTGVRIGTRAEHCSTFSVAGPGYTLLGHNEHWLAGDMGNVAVVVDRSPDDGVVVSPTIVSCLPAVGMNGFGLARGSTRSPPPTTGSASRGSSFPATPSAPGTGPTPSGGPGFRPGPAGTATCSPSGAGTRSPWRPAGPARR